MAIIKSFTDLQQSKKLAEILPLESADMCWQQIYDENHMMSDYRVELIPYRLYSGIGVPCWSLAALRNFLPSAIKPNKDSYLFESHNTFDNSWVYRYYNEDGASYLYYKDASEVDACVEMILKLNELNLL